jgi:predicted glycogen debranching enzyme
LKYLTECQMKGLIPSQIYQALGTRLERTTAMLDAGTVGYFYEIDCPMAATLTLEGLFSDRDMHATSIQMPKLTLERSGDTLNSMNAAGEALLTVRLVGADVVALEPSVQPQMLHYAAELERGESCADVVARAGMFAVQLPAGHSRFALVVSATSVSATGWEGEPYAALEWEQNRRLELVALAHHTTPIFDETLATLALAADAYVVQRHSVNSKTIIAGYPWFADWGRDAMIALPGLTLPTGRFAEARAILQTFLKYQQRGLLPNNFWDDGTGAGYNTVDGGLWLFVALERYLQAQPDPEFARSSLPILREMLQHHITGTDFGIALDPLDGLLSAGERGVQLTWMDVKIKDWVVTPRHGKAVEICALWINALEIYLRLSAQLGHIPSTFEQQCMGILEQAKTAFETFWNPSLGYYFDYIDPQGQKHPELRPNALIALALPYTPSSAEQRRATLETARLHLITPYGPYSLAPCEAAFRPDFTGSQLERDSAYHQGTVWAWPMGSYLELLWRETRDVGLLEREFAGLLGQLHESGLGAASEVYEAGTLLSKGCPFQAWSVSELLRVYTMVKQVVK